MSVVATGIPSPPVSVSGTGTTAKQFGSTLYLPGSNRLNGKMFKIRAAGNFVTGTTGNCSLNITATYPSGQYAAANITGANLVSNVATYIAKNNYVAGQYITVSGATNTTLNFSTAKAVASANSTQFTVAITSANIANDNTAGFASAVASVPVFTGTVESVTTAGSAFQFEAVCSMDNVSNTLQGTATSMIVNTVADAIAAIGAKVPGINLAAEPALQLNVAALFGTSNASNSATLNYFVLDLN